MWPSSCRPWDVSAPTERDRAAWAAQLRAAGRRVTPQRTAVLEAVYRLGHATAESIDRSLQADNRDTTLSTVYRALEALEDVGLVRHTHIGPGAPVYHVAAESEHIHLRCDQCGSVQSIATSTSAPFIEAVLASTGFRADIAHAAIHGTCAQCLAADKPRGESWE